MADSSRMQKLLQRKAQIEQQLKQQQRVEAERARKRDNRRKILRGAIVETFASPELAAQVDALMKKHLKERDRHLFPELFGPACPANDRTHDNEGIRGEFQDDTKIIC